MQKIISTVKYMYFVFWTVVLFTIPVHGYLDPSVMTYAIQAVAGAAIALGTVAGFAWRKFRKKILHTDTSKYREYETDALSFRDPAKNNAVITPEHIIPEKQQAQVITDGKRTLKDKWHDFVRSYIPGITLSAAFAFMIAIYAPLEIYMNNKPEFWFDFSILLPQQLKMFMLIFLAGILVLLIAYLLYDQFYEVLLIAGMILFLCLYIQGNFLAGNMPPTDGSTIDWSLYRHDMLISFGLCISILVITVLLVRFLKKESRHRLFNYMNILISLMLTVSLISINLKTDGTEKKPNQYAVTNNYLFTLSEDENFIIFIVDAVDSKIVTSLLDTYPEYQTAFKDFTFYPNTISAYPYTSRSIPFILNGKWYLNEESFDKFQTEAMSQSRLLASLKQQNFRLTCHSTYIVDNSEHLFDFDNIIKIEKKISTPRQFKKLQLKLTLYKYMPFFLKKYFITDISDFADTQAVPKGISKYSYLNRKFIPLMKKTEIDTIDDKMFKLIHIEGGHVPFNMNKNLDAIDEKDGIYADKAGAALTIASQFLDKLKNAGVYDNSTIIIMSDHGFCDETKQIGANRHNPLFFVKAGTETHSELIKNDAPISYDDLQDIYQKLLEGKLSNDVSEYHAGDSRIRRFLSYYPYTNTSHMEEIEYFGHAWDYENKKPTGNVYDLAEE